MPSKSQSLEAWLTEEIRRDGPIGFDRFMEAALYHPEYGYYSSDRARIGRAGDFFTSVSVGRMFGVLLASQILEMWEILGRPAPFEIVEQGAADGRLAADILDALAGGPLADTVLYRIIEPCEPLRPKQQSLLADRPVRWNASLEEVDAFTGVHVSNELIDAMPVRLLVSDGDGWMERRVACGDGGFRFVEAPAAPGRLPPLMPAGYVTEIREAHRPWLRLLAEKMTAGFVLITDYGMTRDRLYAPHRTEGTLSCYHNHRRDADPLLNPGEKDITAHVDFTGLAEAAVEAGFSVAGFADQHHFLIGVAEPVLRSDGSGLSLKDRRALQTLIHPESMGTQFHSLCLAIGLNGIPALGGFRYARKSATEFLR